VSADRDLAEVLEDLRRAEAELVTRRREVAELMGELEATNRGLIALHGELERAREAEAQLAAIVRSSDDAMYSMTLDRRISSWNPAAERLLGHRAADIIGSPVEILVPETARADLDRAIERLQAGEPAARYETWRRRADGSLVEVIVTLSSMCDPEGRMMGYSALLYDLTERRRTEEELAAVRASQEVFAERDRIARDLHDLAIQRLFAAGISLQGTQTLAPAPVAERIDRVIDELDATISEIRSTIFTLQHGPQQAASLRARLLEQASKAAGGLGFAPRVVFSGPVDAAVPDQVAEHLLAVVREALSNVARHAGARSVEVSVDAADELVLRVVDDGRGLGPSTRRSGLGNMADRARELGGSFSATGEDGAGTRLEWRVPL
jgi:two-component system, NarL family, sensor histidine kinase DevS